MSAPPKPGAKQRSLLIRPCRLISMRWSNAGWLSLTAMLSALSVPEGCVRIDWSHPNDGLFLLRWTEVGGPSVKPPRRQGFGGRVIDQLVRHELKGEMRYDWRAQGLTCEIVFPAAAIIG